MKNHLLSLLALAVLAVLPQPLSAQNTAKPAILREPSPKLPPTPVQLRMEKFFLSIQNKQIQEAYNTLLADSDLDSKEEQVRELISKTGNVLAEIGPVTFYEIYDNRAAGSRMMALTYFSYQAKKPLRWRFVFYAATPEQWRVINLSVDDLVAESFLSDR